MPILRPGERKAEPYSGSNLKQAPLCGACKRPAYAAESYIMADRTSYHRKCLKCAECKRGLTPGQQKTHEKEIFCMRCYEEIFNPKVQGFSICIRSPLMKPTNDDERSQKDAMLVLPHDGMFPLKQEKDLNVGLSEEELKRQEELRKAQEAWEEAQKKGHSYGDNVRIKEAVTIMSDMDSHSLC